MATKQERKELKSALQRRKLALQTEIARTKLLQGLAGRTKTSPLTPVPPRPPSVFIKEEPKKEKAMFLSQGRLL